MKRLLVVLMISGCLAVDVPPVEQQQQAVGGIADAPDTIGDANARLGAGLSTCAFGDGNLVVASAPGVKRIYSLGSNVTISPTASNAFDNGGSIGCASVTFPDGGPRASVFIAGPAGQTLSGGFFQLSGTGNAKRTAALANLGAFVVGSTFFVGDVILPGGYTTGDAGHLLVDLAFESQSSVVVLPNDAMQVTRFAFRDGGWNESGAIATSFFGRRLVVGDVLPSAGREIIVAGSNGALGEVQIYSANGALLATRSGANGFGSSLAIERGAAFGLDALWVGESGTSSVWRFVGSAVTKYVIGVDPLSEAGAAITVNASREVWVGAPGYAGGKGAVFFIGALDAGIDVCMTSADCGGCNQNCVGGQCSVSYCPVNEICLEATKTCVGIDAGSIDAGSIDAGSIDAGTIDAGSIDAGSIDAGSIDAGLSDAGFSDAGFSDAGFSDAGFSDAGVVDAGLVDAGLGDAGTLDAGAVDAGAPDAGASDAGPIDAGVPPSDGGPDDLRPSEFVNSGCSSTGAMVGVMALALVLRRRRS